MVQATIFKTDRHGRAILGPAKVAKVMGNRRRWTIVGYRSDVSATVLERLLSVDFYTKREAVSFLREHSAHFP